MSEILTKEDKMRELYEQIENMRQEINKLRLEIPPQPISDYELENTEGEKVKLSDLFEDGNELLIIHNMGKGCRYCTLWADGFNGLHHHIENRVPMVLVSPDSPEVQKEFANSRNWTLKTLSAHNSSFIEDLGFKSEKSYMPGVSALVKKEDGTIVRVSKDYFGPGDIYNSVWNLFDLLPKGHNNWNPKYSY